MLSTSSLRCFHSQLSALRADLKNFEEQQRSSQAQRKQKKVGVEPQKVDEEAEGSGLFSFCAPESDDDDDCSSSNNNNNRCDENHEAVVKSLGAHIDPHEARQPRFAARLLLQLAERQKAVVGEVNGDACRVSSIVTSLTVQLDSLLACEQQHECTTSRTVHVQNVHMPLGIGADAVVFRGELLHSSSSSSSSYCSYVSSPQQAASATPVAVRVVMRHLRDEEGDILSAVESACRAVAISSAVFSSSSIPECERNVLRSFGAYVMRPSFSASVPDSVVFIVSLWELAIHPRSTWQAQINNSDDNGGGDAASSSHRSLLLKMRLRQCLQVAHGVRALHSVWFVHRDVKGMNCLVVERTRGEQIVVLGDLDSCLQQRRQQDGGTDAMGTEDGVMEEAEAPAGTVWFAAPELISDPSLGLKQRLASSLSAASSRAAFATAAKADVWSLGLIFLSVIGSALHDPRLKSGRFLYDALDEQQQQQEQQEVASFTICEKLRSVGARVAQRKRKDDSTHDDDDDEDEDEDEDDEKLLLELAHADFPKRRALLFASVEERNDKKLRALIGSILFRGCLCVDPEKRMDLTTLINRLSEAI